jgi:hypothetical protein
MIIMMMKMIMMNNDNDDGNYYDDVYLRKVQHGGFLVYFIYMSYVKHINPAFKA